MNRLDDTARVQVLRCLVDGMSVRATCRITGVAKNTVLKLIVDFGNLCGALHDAMVRGITPNFVEMDKVMIGLQAYKQKLTERSDWKTPAALCASLLGTLCTASFKEMAGFSADTWAAVFIMTLGLSALWLFQSCANLWKHRNCDPDQELIDTLKGRRESSPSVSGPTPGTN